MERRLSDERFGGGGMRMGMGRAFCVCVSAIPTVVGVGLVRW